MIDKELQVSKKSVFSQKRHPGVLHARVLLLRRISQIKYPLFYQVSVYFELYVGPFLLLIELVVVVMAFL